MTLYQYDSNRLQNLFKRVTSTKHTDKHVKFSNRFVSFAVCLAKCFVTGMRCVYLLTLVETVVAIFSGFWIFYRDLNRCWFVFLLILRRNHAMEKFVMAAESFNGDRYIKIFEKKIANFEIFMVYLINFKLLLIFNLSIISK